MKAVCVFCGAKTGRSPRWTDLAIRVGAELAGRGITMVYGGGSVGLMGAMAESALARGGEVVGVIPQSLMRQEQGKFEVSRLEVVETLAARKTRMMALADAFLVLPGGLGTLDELFEVLTLRQIGLHAKPMGILNDDGYFDPLRVMLERFVAAGFVAERDVAHLRYDADPTSLLTALQAAAEPDAPGAAAPAKPD